MVSARTVIVCGAGYVSGKEIVAIELGQGLANRGHSPFFLVSTWNNGDFISRLETDRLPFELMPLGFISARFDIKNLKMTCEQLLKWPRLLFSYRRMLKREQPSVVIHTNWHHLLLLWMFLRPDRDLFWIHETLPLTNRYRRFFKLLSKRMSFFVSVSNAVANRLKELGIREDKVCVIYNGIRDLVPSSGGSRPTTGPLRIGIVGQVGSWKGHQDLIDAVAEATRRRADVRVDIFGNGDGNFVRELTKRAQSLGVADKVTWHGFQQDRALIYGQMDVCVVPSRSHDPLPTTAIEAALFSVPVIATAMGGLPEIVKDGKTGFLVDVKSSSQIADALCKFAEDPALCQDMGKAARQHAIEKFGSGRFVIEFTQILDAVPSASVQSPTG